MKKRTIIPEETTGYVLNPERSYFALVLPEETVNLVVNPECVDTYTYYGLSATVASSTAAQRRGAKSLLVTPSGALGGCYHRFPGELSAGQTYTFSVDLLGPCRVRLYFGDVSGGQISSFMDVSLPAFWTRQSITDNLPADTQSVVVRSLDGDPFYADGWQCERKPYATTFVSGNLEVPLDTVLDNQATYGWFGPTHRSRSFRTRWVPSGGRPVPFDELGMEVTEFSGFGHAVPEIFVQRFALSDGGFYQGQSIAERQFTVGGWFRGGRLLDVLAARGEFSGMAGKPIALHVQLYDDVRPVSEVVEVECAYVGGLEGVHASVKQEKVAISFRAWNPYLRSQGNRSAVLATTDVEHDATITSYLADGSADAIPADGYSMNDPVDFTYRMALGVDGMIYATNGNDLLRYTSSGVEVIKHSANGIMRDVVAAPDGWIYYAYDEDEPGSCNYSHIERYSPISGAIDTMSTTRVYASHDYCRIHRLRLNKRNNRLYVAGAFTELYINGVAQGGTYGNFECICYMDMRTGAWNDFLPVDQGGGAYTPCVYDVAFDDGNREWIVGDFITGGDMPGWDNAWGWGCNYQGAWRAGTMTFASGDGWDDIAGRGPRHVVFNSQDQCVYAGGAAGMILWWYFSEYSDWGIVMGGVLPAAMARIDCLSFAPFPVRTGILDGLGGAAAISDMAMDPDGNRIYVTGDFTEVHNPKLGYFEAIEQVWAEFPYNDYVERITANGIGVFSCAEEKWQTSAMRVPVPAHSVIAAPAVVNATQAYTPVDLPESASWDDNSDIPLAAGGSVYIAHYDANLAQSPITTVDMAPGSRFQCRLEVTGPCRIDKIVNATTGKSMSPAISVAAGETVIFSFRPGPAWIRSTTRGSIPYPNLGKDAWPDLGFTPGINRIALALSGRTASTQAILYWTTEHATLDEVVRKNAA